MPTFKVPRLPRRRTLAAAIAAGVVGSFLVTAAPASAQVVSCNPPHTNNWAKVYPDFDSFLIHNSPVATCIGFVGDNPMDAAGSVFCAGNNQGTVTYLDDSTGTFGRHTFWPGGVYEVVNGTYTQSIIATPDFIEVVDVTINGYSGNSPC